MLDARPASAAGDAKSAVTSWKEAVEIQDRLIYDEPPAWYYPVRESLGGEYLRLRQYGEGEKVFRRDLEINRNNPRSLFGLTEALRGQSKRSDEFRRQFENQWQGSADDVSVAGL